MLHPKAIMLHLPFCKSRREAEERGRAAEYRAWTGNNYHGVTTFRDQWYAIYITCSVEAEPIMEG